MGKGGGGLLGGVSETLFGDGGAKAAGRAAMAQQAMANRAFTEIKSLGDIATTEGLAQFDKALAAQERSIARQEQMISQIDPTIVEASQQALRLLRGESASSLKPVEEQRARQRQKLVDTLRGQLGPGAETSTAGIQALTRFDQETSSLMAGTQQQALSQAGNIFSQFNSGRPDMLREAAGFGELAQGRAGLRYNQANLLQGAYQPLIGTAGAQHVAAQMRGQNAASFGQSLLGGAMTLGAGYALGDPTKSTRLGSWLGGGG